MPRMRASTSAQLGFDTRSVLLSTITSAKAIWFLASGASFSRSLQPLGVGHRHHGVEPRLLHVLVDEEGLRHRRRIGEARGLDDDGVELALAPHQPSMMRIRSPRTVQQTQPLFISNTSSSAPTTRSLSMPISPNSLTITAYFLPCVFGQDAVEQRGLAGAEIAGQHGDGDFRRGGAFISDINNSGLLPSLQGEVGSIARRHSATAWPLRDRLRGERL